MDLQSISEPELMDIDVGTVNKQNCYLLDLSRGNYKFSPKMFQILSLLDAPS